MLIIFRSNTKIPFHDKYLDLSNWKENTFRDEDDRVQDMPGGDGLSRMDWYRKNHLEKKNEPKSGASLQRRIQATGRITVEGPGDTVHCDVDDSWDDVKRELWSELKKGNVIMRN